MDKNLNLYVSLKNYIEDIIELFPKETINFEFEPIEKECEVCGKRHIQFVEGFNICKECFEESTKCSKCGKWHLNSTSTIVDDNTYCSDCINTIETEVCEVCGKRHIKENMVDTDIYKIKGHTKVCKKCLDYLFTLCHNCRMYELRSNVQYCSYCKKNLCLDCYNSEEHGNCGTQTDKIESYGFTPRLRFRQKGKQTFDTTYLGFELELELKNKEEAFDKFIKGSSFLYATRDGTIANGFEITSHPTELEVLLESEELKNLMSGIVKYHNPDVPYQGLHVHFNNGNMDPNSFINIRTLMHSNKAFFTNFAGRESSYAEFTPKNTINEYLFGNGFSNRGAFYEHHGNKVTSEIRIFKGLPDYNYLLASLELTHALKNFGLEFNVFKYKNTENKNYNKEILSYFIKYINNHSDIYRHCIERIDSNNLNKHCEDLGV